MKKDIGHGFHTLLKQATTSGNTIDSSHSCQTTQALCWVILACECCDYGERTALEGAS